MSEFEETRLTEVDKLMKKIDSISNYLKGGAQSNEIKIDDLKGEFEKYRVVAMKALSDADVFLKKRDEIHGDRGKELLEKTKLSENIENLLKSVEVKLSEMDRYIKAGEKNPKKYGDLSYKKTAYELIKKRYEILNSKFTGMPIEEKNVEENLTTLQQVDLILQKCANDPSNPYREPNEAELDFFKEVNQGLSKQEETAKEVASKVKVLKGISNQMSTSIKEVGKEIKKTSEAAKKTEKKLETTNAKLKDLLEKIRSGDRICIDILLVLICLGLIAVLYNTIKSRLGSSSSNTSNNTSKTFLYI